MKSIVLAILLFMLLSSIDAIPVSDPHWNGGKSALVQDKEVTKSLKASGGDLEGSESAYVFYPRYPFYPAYHYPYVIVGK